MEFDMGLLVPIIALLMPIAIVGIVMYFRAKSRAEVQKTIRLAIEKGQPLPKEYLDSLQKTDVRRVKSPMDDVRTGLILMAVGIGLSVFSFMKEGYVGGNLAGIAAIPGFIGVALFILGLIGLNRKA